MVTSEKIKTDFLRIQNIIKRIQDIDNELNTSKNHGRKLSLVKERELLVRKAKHTAWGIKEVLRGIVTVVTYKDSTGAIHKECFTNTMDTQLLKAIIETTLQENIKILEYNIFNTQQLASIL